MNSTQTVGDRIRAATVRKVPNAIQLRQLDASRRELHSMISEIEHYGMNFSRPQLLAMRKTMRALKELIAALENETV